MTQQLALQKLVSLLASCGSLGMRLIRAYELGKASTAVIVSATVSGFTAVFAFCISLNLSPENWKLCSVLNLYKKHKQRNSSQIFD